MEGIENLKFDNEKDKEKLKKTYQKLIKEREKVNDSGPRYYAMIDVLSNNSLYKNIMLLNTFPYHYLLTLLKKHLIN